MSTAGTRLQTTAIVLSVLLAAALPAVSEELYRSNAAGIAVTPIDAAERGGLEYVLEVREDEGTRERLLYRDGEVTRRERMRLDERGRIIESEEYRGGVLRSVKRYDERGRLREELAYDDTGLLAERIEIRYENGRRTAERHFGPADELLFTDRFSYDADGRIRKVERVRDGETVRSVTYAYAEGELFEESFRTGNTRTVVRYGGDGSVAYRAERRGGELVREREYRIEPDGTRVVTTRTPAESTVTVERYRDGRLMTSTERRDGELVRVTDHEYEDGRLSRTVTEGPDLAGARTELYEYDEDGELERRTVRSDGRMLRTVVYLGDRVREEITYREGRPFLRVRYRDDNPVSRELVSRE